MYHGSREPEKSLCLDPFGFCKFARPSNQPKKRQAVFWDSLTTTKVSLSMSAFKKSHSSSPTPPKSSVELRSVFQTLVFQISFVQLSENPWAIYLLLFCLLEMISVIIQQNPYFQNPWKQPFSPLSAIPIFPSPLILPFFFFKVAQPSPNPCSTAFERCVWNTGTVQGWTHSANLLLRKVVLCIVGRLWSCSWHIGRYGSTEERAEDGSPTEPWWVQRGSPSIHGGNTWEGPS